MSALRKLFVIFDGPPSHESGRFIEVEDEKGASHGKDAGLGWEHVSPFIGPDTWRLGPFLTVKDAGVIAENAVGLFLEQLYRSGGSITFAGTSFEPSKLPEGVTAQEMVDQITVSAVQEVVQGVEADVPL